MPLVFLKWSLWKFTIITHFKSNNNLVLAKKKNYPPPYIYDGKTEDTLKQNKCIQNVQTKHNSLYYKST